MAWLISQAMMQAYENSRCSQEREAESSEVTYSDGEPFAPLSGNPTQLAYLPPDRMTAFSRPSRSGMTFRPLTEDLGAAVLMWCRGVSRARTSALPAREQASTASDPACGDTWRGSLARFDPATSSWRTAQPSLLGDSDECSVTWPRSGMTAGGRCWELPTLGRRISGTGSGLWVPTPCAIDAKPITGGNLYITETGTVRHTRPDGKSSNRGLAATVATWPTPTSISGHQIGRLDEWGGSRSREVMRALVTPQELGGSLNPTWVEWLMGWPLGWTDLKPLEMARCPSAPPLPGNC